jgi:hypothetical protein
MKLSEHFTLEELTFSQEAARRGLNNDPPPRIVENLTFLAARLEEVRALLQAPMVVSSGYRSPAVNDAVGGSATSQHRFGLAADFCAPVFGDPFEVATAIAASPIQVDQLILEFGRWVHVSFVRNNPRRQALSIFSQKEGYLPGIRQRFGK